VHATFVQRFRKWKWDCFCTACLKGNEKMNEACICMMLGWMGLGESHRSHDGNLFIITQNLWRERINPKLSLLAFTWSPLCMPDQMPSPSIDLIITHIITLDSLSVHTHAHAQWDWKELNPFMIESKTLRSDILQGSKHHPKETSHHNSPCDSLE